MSSSDDVVGFKTPDESIEGFISFKIVNDNEIDFEGCLSSFDDDDDDNDNDDEEEDDDDDNDDDDDDDNDDNEDNVINETLEFEDDDDNDNDNEDNETLEFQDDDNNDDDDVKENTIDGTFKNSVLYSPKMEIKEKFVNWSSDSNPHFNDEILPNYFANDTFDETGLGVLIPQPSEEIIYESKEKRRRIEESKDGIFEILPDEIVLNIFKCTSKETLSQLMQVNHRFQRIGCDKSLWYHFNFNGQSVKPGHLGIVLSRGVESLCVKDSKIQGSSLFPPYTFNCGMLKYEFDSFQVQHLDLSMTVADNDVVAELFRLSKKVSHLSLQHCNLPSTTLHLVAQMKNLCVLNLSTRSTTTNHDYEPLYEFDSSRLRPRLDSEAIVQILKNCSKLRILNLAWGHFSTTSLCKIISHLPSSILHLNLSGNTLFSNKILQLLADKCPYLQVLDVSDSPQLTVTSIAIFCEQFLQLCHLSISRCYGLQPPLIFIPLASHRTLFRLDMFHIMNTANLKELMTHFRHEFEINQCYFSHIAQPTLWDKPAITYFDTTSRSIPFDLDLFSSKILAENFRH